MNFFTPKTHLAADPQNGACPSTQKFALGRRGFLTISAAAAGGLLIGLSRIPSARAATTATVNVFVVIGSDNSITMIVPGAEMGQGINGALAQVLAEELPIDWAGLKTISAPFGAQYGRGASRSQTTGGSNNMRGWFNLMLQAGATARELLLMAGRQTFPSAALPLKAVAGFVQDANGTVLASYGELAPLAATLTLPAAAAILSTPATRKVIGQSLKRPDIALKVDGRAIYGIDVRVPGMVHAAIRHCPTIGGTVATVGAAPTGSQLFNLGNAIAATGPNTWAAIKNARAAAVKWTLPTSTALNAVDSAALSTAAKTLMNSTTPSIAENTGDTVAALAGAAKKLTLTYTLPLLAHACMEVMNCTVAIAKDAAGVVTACQIWAPTQAPDGLAKTAAPLLGLNPALPADLAKITVTTTYLGGGLGRKIENDTAVQAIRVALALNKPVKLVWPREEDFARDWFRPSALSRVTVGLNAAGNIVGWANRIVSPSLARSHGRTPATTGDGISIGGATRLLYATGPRLVEYVEQLAPNLQIGFWRSVGESISCFVVESAIDECALAAGWGDPLQYRLNLLGSNTAVKAVLQAAATLGGWGTPLASGRARGIALSPGFGSMTAVVAEISLNAAGGVKVEQLSCAVDCGVAVNPNQVASQIEGGLLHGLSAARWHKVTLEKGLMKNINFGEYKMGKMADTPKIKVTIVSQGSALGGIGEVGVPAVAPALANAYAKLTGTRKRSLPLGI